MDAVSGFVHRTELVLNALFLPATLTAQAYFDAGGVKPYVRAGVTCFIWLDAEPLPLGVTDTDLSDEFGFVLQAGLSIPIGDDGFGVTFDTKRCFIGTAAPWNVNDALVTETDHNIDPWVLSAGLSYRF